MAASSTSSKSKTQRVKTRSGAADTDGVDYENCMRLLTLLRLLKKENVKEFYIAKNVDELGAFDDLVIKVKNYKPLGEDTSTTKLILVQLKHCQKKNKTIVSRELTNVEEKGGKFQLKKYFDSYKTIISNIEKFENEILNDCSVEDMTFVLFTNAKFSIGDNSRDSSLSAYYRELLETGHKKSNVFGIDTSKQFERLHSEMKKNKNPIIQGEDGFKFLTNMVIFSEQSNVKKLKNILMEEFKDYIAGDNMSVDFALQMALNFMTKNGSKWLSRHFEVLSTVEFLYQGVAVKLSEAEHFWTPSIIRKILVKHICSDMENGVVCVGKEMKRSEDYYIDRCLYIILQDSGMNHFMEEAEWRNEISEDPLVLICGAPGMGKSSFFTRQAELIKLQNPMKFVIRSNLVDYSEYFSNMNVEGDPLEVAKMFLAEISGVSLGTLEYEIFECSLDTKDMMVIFLDGVDEISPNYYCKLLVVIQAIQEIFPVKLFVSTRPVVKERMENDLRVVHWQLYTFEIKDSDIFFEKYCKVDAQEVGRAISNAVLDLLGIPIFCRMVGDIFNNSSVQNTADLFRNMSNKSQIYDTFVDVMLEEYHRDKLNIDVNIPGAQYLINNQVKVVLEQHETLALLEIFDKYELQIIKGNIETQSSEALTKISEGIDKSGFIVNIKDGRPSFLHRTIAEYFCGRWFGRNVNKYTKLLSNNIHLPEEVDYFMSHKLPNQHKLFITILNVHKSEAVEAVVAEFKSELNMLDPLNRSVLHYAHISVKKNAARYLLYNGFIIDEMVTGNKLHYDDIIGSEILLFWLNTILLKYKECGTTAIHLISLIMCEYYDETVFLLLQNSKESPLHSAILKENKEDIAKLLNCEDINSRNVLGLTPLHLAVYMEDEDTVNILGERGAEYSKDNVCGMYPHQLVMYVNQLEKSTCPYIYSGVKEILTKSYLGFMKEGIAVAEVLAEDYVSQGLFLHDAVQKKDLQRVRHLINSEGCDINQIDSKGRTALHVLMAEKTGSHKFLLEALQGIKYVQDFDGIFPHDYKQYVLNPHYYLSLGYAFACGLELLPEDDKTIFNNKIEDLIFEEICQNERLEAGMRLRPSISPL